MRNLLFRIQCSYYLWNQSTMTISDAWRYAKGMERDYWAAEEYSAAEAVEIEMSYWDEDA